MELDFTHHFIRRVRKRVGLNKKGAKAWAEKFIDEGHPSSEFGGHFEGYLRTIENDPNHVANSCMVRAPYIILLKLDVGRPPHCITLYHVPAQFRRSAFKKRKTRRAASGNKAIPTSLKEG